MFENPCDAIVNSANPHPICGGDAECPIFSQLVENAPTENLEPARSFEKIPGHGNPGWGFFYPFKMCTAQENANFAELKIFCQKILGILG